LPVPLPLLTKLAPVGSVEVVSAGIVESGSTAVMPNDRFTFQQWSDFQSLSEWELIAAVDDGDAHDF